LAFDLHCSGLTGLASKEKPAAGNHYYGDFEQRACKSKEETCLLNVAAVLAAARYSQHLFKSGKLNEQRLAHSHPKVPTGSFRARLYTSLRF